MDIKQFVKENDIRTKIAAALEQVFVGGGEAIFDGLQTGSVSIGIAYDGTNVSFHKLERIEPVEIPVASLGIKEQEPEGTNTPTQDQMEASEPRVRPRRRS